MKNPKQIVREQSEVELALEKYEELKNVPMLALMLSRAYEDGLLMRQSIERDSA